MARFRGTSGSDTFAGISEADVADGRAGNDSLAGGSNSDTLAGGADADTIDGGSGGDLLFSGNGVPGLDVPHSELQFILQSLDAGAKHDVVNGGEGDDIVFAGYGDDIDGGAEGSSGDHLYISFQGADRALTIDLDMETLSIGGGVITGFEEIDLVLGSEFGDSITGIEWSDDRADSGSIYGMGGNDTLVAGYYSYNLHGGDGDDQIDGRSSLFLSNIWGDDGNDVIYLGSSTNASGGAGDDRIYGGGLVHGESGNDTIEAGSYYGDPVFGDGGDDLLLASSIGSHLVGGIGSDRLVGNTGADHLVSGDLLYDVYPLRDLGRNHDVLTGGEGDDTVDAGYGDDIDGGAGIDILSLSLAGAGTGVTFDSGAIATGQSAVVAGGTIAGVETLANLLGSAFGDTFVIATHDSLMTIDAGAGNDVITTDESSVSLNAGAGKDRIVSGAAADTIDGGEGTDTVDYRNATVGGTVTLGIGNDDQGSGFGGDMLFHIEGVAGSRFDDELSGSERANSIAGGAGDDTIAGEAGADSLYGQLGLDRLSGGAGADRFVFASLSETGRNTASADRIVDFEGGDRVDLHGIADRARQDFTWVGTAVFSGQAGELRYYQSGGSTYVEGDVNGDGSRDFKIGLDGLHALTGIDFIL